MYNTLLVVVDQLLVTVHIIMNYRDKTMKGYYRIAQATVTIAIRVQA